MIGQDDERRHNGEDTDNRALSIYDVYFGCKVGDWCVINRGGSAAEAGDGVAHPNWPGSLYEDVRCQSMSLGDLGLGAAITS